MDVTWQSLLQGEYSPGLTQATNREERNGGGKDRRGSQGNQNSLEPGSGQFQSGRDTLENVYLKVRLKGKGAILQVLGDAVPAKD